MAAEAPAVGGGSRQLLILPASLLARIVGALPRADRGAAHAACRALRTAANATIDSVRLSSTDSGTQLKPLSARFPRLERVYVKRERNLLDRQELDAEAAARPLPRALLTPPPPNLRTLDISYLEVKDATFLARACGGTLATLRVGGLDLGAEFAAGSDLRFSALESIEVLRWRCGVEWSAAEVMPALATVMAQINAEIAPGVVRGFAGHKRLEELSLGIMRSRHVAASLSALSTATALTHLRLQMAGALGGGGPGAGGFHGELPPLPPALEDLDLMDGWPGFAGGAEIADLMFDARGVARLGRAAAGCRALKRVAVSNLLFAEVSSSAWRALLSALAPGGRLVIDAATTAITASALRALMRGAPSGVTLEFDTEQCGEFEESEESEEEEEGEEEEAEEYEEEAEEEEMGEAAEGGVAAGSASASDSEEGEEGGEGAEGEEGEEGEDYPSVCIIKPLGLGPQPDLPSVTAELAAARSAGLAVGVTVLWGEMPL